MKLAEALLLRTDEQNKVIDLHQRLLNNVKVQEGDKPHEEPSKLLAEIDKANDELNILIKKINHVNNTELLESGQVLAEALVDRDTLIRKRQNLTKVLQGINTQDYRLTRSEIKMRVTLNVEEIQKQLDLLAKELRMLDSTIQAKNWTTEI